MKKVFCRSKSSFMFLMSVILFSLLCSCGSTTAPTNNTSSSPHIEDEQVPSFDQSIPDDARDDESVEESQYMSSTNGSGIPSDSPDPTHVPTPEPTPAPTPDPTPEPTAPPKRETTYVLNTKTMKIHNTWCNSVEKIKQEN